MKYKNIFILLVVLFIVPIACTDAAGDNDPAPGTNNDDVRPKIKMVEIGSVEYITSSNFVHDLSVPFDIYVYVDGYNEISGNSIDWNDVQVYLIWSYIDAYGKIYGPYTYELITPINVGEYKRYHIPIPDQDGSMDTSHTGIITYYPYDGNTLSSFGEGTVLFYTYTELVSDSNIRCYYQYPNEQYTAINQMRLIYVDNTVETSTEPLQPYTTPAVGLEDIPVIGETLNDIAQSFGITDNPLLVAFVVVGVGGLIVILFIKNRVKYKNEKQSARKAKKTDMRKKKRFLDNLFPAPSVSKRHRKVRRK